MKSLQAGVVALCEELGDFQEPSEALEPLLTGCQKLFACDYLALFSAISEPTAFQPVAGLVKGLDHSTSHWFDDFYLQSKMYRRDSLNQAMRKRFRGVQAARGQDLVHPSVWARDPIQQELRRVIGIQDVLGAVTPLAGGALVFSLHRSSDSSQFSEEACQAMHLLMRLAGWYFRALERTGGLFPASSSPTLPPRLERLLRELLQGESEKEIASKTGLSPRTVHKYVEELYSFYGVGSRPQLMALFVYPPEPRWWAPGFVPLSDST